MLKGYLIGSLRNSELPHIACDMRVELGVDVFDDWYAVGPEADDHWMTYEKGRGRTMAGALKGRSATHTFEWDKKHLDSSDFVVLVLPCGRSGHMELGYAIGIGKPAFVLYDGDPDRWDVMYQFATCIATSLPDLYNMIRFQFQERMIP